MTDNVQNTVVEAAPEANVTSGFGFKFFKKCSTSLKRLSVVVFILNLFFLISFIVIATVFLGVWLGFEMLSFLSLPIITVFVIGVVIARLISALIYGFAEIVEKNENK